MWIVLIVGGVLAFLAFRRRSAPPSYGAYNNPNAPMPGQPGYPNSPGYPPGYPPPGSGAGHTVAAGLGGLAAGMLAEHLIEGAMDRRHDASGNPLYVPQGDTAPSETLENRPIDFGSSNDWGSDSGGSAIPAAVSTAAAAATGRKLTSGRPTSSARRPPAPA